MNDCRSRFACLLSVLLCFLTLLTEASTARAQTAYEIQPLRSRVVDSAGVLSPADRAQIETMIAGLEQEKGSQLIVFTIDSTAPETIEQLGIRLAEAWKVGRQRVDDGAILIVAVKDHAARIEVGYGLEGVLPDAISNRIIQEQMLPHFREDDYGTGIRSGVDALIRTIRKEPLPPASAATHRGPASGSLMNAFIFFLFVGPVAGQVMKSMFGVVLGSILSGLLCGFIASFLVPLWIAAVLGFAGAFIVMISGSGSSLSPFGGRSYRGGFPGGFGGLGGGGGSGGGFSGGGGGQFGGGGATGRW